MSMLNKRAIIGAVAVAVVATAVVIIDPKQYKAQVDRAEALVTKNKAMALKAERDLARIRPLFEQKASSQLDLDNAVAAYESAKADVQLSEARTKENFSVVNLYKALGGGWKDF